jgi:hypothetical protein
VGKKSCKFVSVVLPISLFLSRLRAVWLEWCLYCNVLGFFYSRWKFITLQNSIHNSWLQFTTLLEF